MKKVFWAITQIAQRTQLNSEAKTIVISASINEQFFINSREGKIGDQIIFRNIRRKPIQVFSFR
jgi:hypothetical protein